MVGYRWLDIDRADQRQRAALTLLGVALRGAAAFALVPPAGARPRAARWAWIPTPGRLALSMALAAVPCRRYRALRPWIDRRLFAEQHALAERFERLRAELSDCGGVEELVARAGEGLDALLRPESIATYGREGDAFAPLFVRGRAAPLAFEADEHAGAGARGEGRAALRAGAKQIGPFERAALETLGAEVVVPVLRDGQLVAFTCLAGKRSGDIYTATDLALLGSLAERCADVLARLDADAGGARGARACRRRCAATCRAPWPSRSCAARRSSRASAR